MDFIIHHDCYSTFIAKILGIHYFVVSILAPYCEGTEGIFMIVRPLIFSSFGVDDDVLNYVGLVVFVESFRFGMDVISNFVIIFMVGALAD